jgi:Flp pilus assembly protein CpaB
MAKASGSQWIPSGGVLVVAVVAGLLAAILVNVYLGYVKGQYEEGARAFYVLKEDVPLGQPLQQRSLVPQSIPKPLVRAFEDAKAIEANEKALKVLGMKAPRDLKKGTFLWWPDFVVEEGSREVKIPKGCEMITIRVDPNISLGQALQPGGYVNIRGLFDTGVDARNPRIESLDVMKNVQVRGLNGSPTPVAGRTDITNIQIIVPSEQARKLLQIQGVLKSGHFAIGEVSASDPTTMAEPTIEKEVLALLNRPRAPAATGGAVLPPPPDTPPGPGPVPVVP